jgi:hypothetical protein
MAADGIHAELFEPNRHLPDPFESFRGVTHVLLSIPPGRSGDPAFEAHAHDLLEAGTLEWAGYLSTTAVYGNHDGGWIDENTPLAPTSQRGSQRAIATANVHQSAGFAPGGQLCDIFRDQRCHGLHGAMEKTCRIGMLVQKFIVLKTALALARTLPSAHAVRQIAPHGP